MPLDTASQQLLAQLASANLPPIQASTPQQARDLGRAMRREAPDVLPMHRIEDFPVQHKQGNYSVRLLVPEGPPLGCIVYYHGGGWVVGDIDDFEPMARLLARESQCAVLLVDYRLAPEHPFPAAVQDAFHAVEWAASSMPEILGGELPIVVAGDSAGGNLAAVVARKSVECGSPAIAMQVLIYPVTDADFSRESYREPANQLLLSSDGMRWFWDHYIADPEQRAHADASPLRARNLRGLPPALVMTAEFDPLRDEGEAYAAALLKAGVDVVFSRKAGQMHGFFTMTDVLPSSRPAIKEAGRAVSSHLRNLEVQ